MLEQLATQFIWSPITWILLIVGCPPIYYYEMKYLNKQIDKYFPNGKHDDGGMKK